MFDIANSVQQSKLRGVAAQGGSVHPASLGVSEHAAEHAPTLPAIARINEHLRSVVEHGRFSVACAVLASAESTIPASFPTLSAIARSASPDVDTTFVERHGARDVARGHARPGPSSRAERRMDGGARLTWRNSCAPLAPASDKSGQNGHGVCS
jgi:hypothetical protein